jgi:predicted  nucleic acid-binding Zn-ribbon protein
MPHQCTGCGRVFDDGSKEMLGGCPGCGGTKFQFHPAGADIPEEPTDAEPPERETGGMAERVGRATSTVRDLVGGRETDDGRTSGDWPEPPATDAEDGEIIDADAMEARLQEDGTAQASARGDVAAADELADADAGTAAGDSGTGDVDAGGTRSPGTSTPARDSGDGDSPDLSQLREELNDQFESIRVVEPGQYELNLMGLYDREEYVVALQENGRYVIQMPDDWAGRRPADEE